MIDRAQQFRRALLNGKPLRPQDKEWTLGDLIHLSAAVQQVLAGLPDDDFRTPLAEMMGERIILRFPA